MLKKKRRYTKIGSEPIPKVTCRICRRQVDYDALEIHSQIEHPNYYEEAMNKVGQLFREGLTLEQVMERLANEE